MTKEFYLVSFDDEQGNLGRKSEIIDFFNENKIVCKAGFWGCPWYFVSIEDNIFYPGRPGLAYGKVIGNDSLTFEEFKEIFANTKRF